MNDNMREKLANRTAYAILALLLIAALTVTVVAIVATVNQQEEPLLEDNEPNGEEDVMGGTIPTPWVISKP